MGSKLIISRWSPSSRQSSPSTKSSTFQWILSSGLESCCRTFMPGASTLSIPWLWLVASLPTQNKRARRSCFTGLRWGLTQRRLLMGLHSRTCLTLQRILFKTSSLQHLLNSMKMHTVSWRRISRPHVSNSFTKVSYVRSSQRSKLSNDFNQDFVQSLRPMNASGVTRSLLQNSPFRSWMWVKHGEWIKDQQLTPAVPSHHCWGFCAADAYLLSKSYGRGIQQTISGS